MAKGRKQSNIKELERSVVRDMLWRYRNHLTDKLVHDVLEDLGDRLPGLGEHLAWLAAYDHDSRIWHLGAFLLFSAMRESEIIPDPAKARLQDSARPVLLRALKDPEVSDQRKYTLGPIHHLAGGDMSREEYEACFRDFEGTLHGMMENIFERISDQPENVERTLTDMGLLAPQNDPPPAQASAQSLLHICDHLRGRNDNAVAMLLGSALAAGVEANVPQEEMRHMVEMLGATRCERAAWCLNELANWPALGELSVQAGQFAREMISAGVRPRVTVLSEFSHALVSTVDASGSRSVLVFYRTGEGGMDAVVLLANDRTGMRDAWAVFGDGCVVEERWREEGPEGIQFAQVRLEFVREVVADALALHHEQNRPLPGRLLLLRPYLGVEPILPQRRQPNLGSYMLELMTINPHLVEGSEELADSAVFGSLGFASDKAYEFLRAHLPKRGACRLNKAKLELFAREVALLERQTIIDRVGANLEMESLAGRGLRPENRLAAAAWLGLTQEVVPFEKVGYIRELCKTSVEHIGQNIRMGYQTQDVANAAQMEMEQELSDFEADLADEIDDDEDDEDFDDEELF